jgi:hypothetical protein
MSVGKCALAIAADIGRDQRGIEKIIADMWQGNNRPAFSPFFLFSPATNAALCIFMMAPRNIWSRSMTITTTEILDTPGAAKYLGLSCPTLERMRLTGRGPRFAKLTRASAGRSVTAARTSICGLRNGWSPAPAKPRRRHETEGPTAQSGRGGAMDWLGGASVTDYPARVPRAMAGAQCALPIAQAAIVADLLFGGARHG